MNRRRFLSGMIGGIGAAGLPGPLQAFERSGRARWPHLAKILDDYVAGRRLSGAAIAVAVGGASHVLRAGYRSLDSAWAFDEDSVCRIYSMTKPVTGLAAMILIELGRLGLDQPVADIIPELAAPIVAIDPKTGLDARPATRTMTIRHLLTHSSGLAYWTPEAGTDALSTAYRARGITPGNYGKGLARPGYGPQAIGLDDMVRRLAELPLASEPGTAWRYSVGLDVLGLVIARAAGQPFELFVHDRILAPLGMHSTGFQVPELAQSRLTSNYSVTADGLMPLDPAGSSVFLKPSTLIAGGAGLVSTAHDFARFGAMLLGDGALDGVRIANPSTVRLARSNLLPAGVPYSGGGFGAGMRVAAGGPTARDAQGAMSWNGAAGTMWLLDPARGLNFVFMSQFMPPTSYPIWGEADTALLADLAA